MLARVRSDLIQKVDKLEALIGSSCSHKVVVHRMNKMQKLSLKQLKLLDQLPEHQLILNNKPLFNSHVIKLTLNLLTSTVRS